MIFLTLEGVATQLKISKASVKNWVKSGYIVPLSNGSYSKEDVDKLEDKLNSGEIKRLNSRANKTHSKNKFIPTEYIKNNDSILTLENIVDFITEFNIKPAQCLFLLSVNALTKSGDLDKENLYEALKFNDNKFFKRESVYLELKHWFMDISSGEIKENNKYCNFLLNCELPNERDYLGIIYQSIINEGKKSSLGSYYTPPQLVEDIVKDNLKKEGKVLDPCCGTGQFLLTMADKISDPNNIWGADIDGIAVKITKMNLFLHYAELDFKPNIFRQNSLLEWYEKGFDLIATNPPWGAKIVKKDLKIIKENFPQINSKESFSYFLSFALKYLSPNGRYSFVLPESFLYVKNHGDIRSFLLNNSTIKLINSGGRLFKKVFSSVIRLDGKKTIDTVGSDVSIKLATCEYNISQDRFLGNINNIIDIYCSNKDNRLITKIYSFPHTNLKDKGTWALGIVTGNNDKFLKSNKMDSFEPIIKGKDLFPLRPCNPSTYINFNTDKFQQCAPEELYRAPEKLVYKFISKDLVFSYDNKGYLTLNSANILIPKIDGMPVKVVGAFLNSSIFKFIFRKRFNSIKVLRGDIENLPIPLLSKKETDELLLIVDKYINGDTEYDVIDDYINSYYQLNDDEKSILNI